jgi:hypothetical protein
LLLKPIYHEEFVPQTIETLKQEERLRKDAVIVYAEKYFTVFDLDQYTDIEVYLKRTSNGKTNLGLGRPLFEED